MSEAAYRYGEALARKCYSACKNAATKIQKGELRFGSLVKFKEHTSWKWKHWGCVTPRQIENIIVQLGGTLDGLDLKEDLDILDGYEELPDWAQEKVQYALGNGHVHDEDWKGEPELNRPGMKGINKRTPKKNSNGDGETGDSATESTPTKPKKRTKKKKAANDDEESEEPVPKKKATRKRKAATRDDDDDIDEAPAPKKRGRGENIAVKDEDVDADQPAPAKKRSRGKKVKQEPVDDSEDQGAALPQSDGAGDSEAHAAATKALAKKRGRKAVVKEENTDKEEEAAPKPARANQKKKVKAEPQPEDEDEDVLDDVDKKKQSKRGRPKKAAPTVLPEDEHTDASQPEDVADEADTAEDEIAEATKKGKTSNPSRRNARRTSTK
ncbi:hypothetical protein LTR64_004264 [Lithohypha guttulata]|uniref:uncharacterized protein n=1 Tax=Lithohypha guttulata TaxID=1690604 RepID=UPI002DE03C1B|nr:hypothetical protein LTR51_006441 [Lithohypha guttulata]